MVQRLEKGSGYHDCIEHIRQFGIDVLLVGNDATANTGYNLDIDWLLCEE